MDSLSTDERLRALREFAQRTWMLSDAVAERSDAHIGVTALRLNAAASGARMPKKNDGANAALTMHLAEGCVLLTNETHLVNLVDESKTFQAPWVRRMNDLENLPAPPHALPR